MRLVRNTTPDGKCKYALVRLDKIRTMNPVIRETEEIKAALDFLERSGVLEYAGKNDKEEAFTIKLKDVYAPVALLAYSDAAWNDNNKELSEEVMDLSQRARNRSDRKRPD